MRQLNVAGLVDIVLHVVMAFIVKAVSVDVDQAVLNARAIVYVRNANLDIGVQPVNLPAAVDAWMAFVTSWTDPAIAQMGFMVQTAYDVNMETVA